MYMRKSPAHCTPFSAVYFVTGRQTGGRVDEKRLTGKKSAAGPTVCQSTARMQLATPRRRTRTDCCQARIFRTPKFVRASRRAELSTQQEK